MCFRGAPSSILLGVRRKPEQFPLIIDDQMKFESIEPAQGTFPFPSAIPLKVLCCLSLLIWHLWVGVESIKEIPVHFPNALILRKTASGTQAFRSNSTNRL